MVKNSNLFVQEHYVAPSLKSFAVKHAGAICLGSPAFGGNNEAGDEIDIENSYDL